MKITVSLGLAHELGFACAMMLSIAIVLLGGELPLPAWLLCAAPCISCALALAGRSVPALAGTLVGLAGLALGVVTLVRGGLESSVLAGGEVLLALLAARLLVRNTAAHDLQAIALSLLLVLTASVLNVGAGYIVVFVPYAVAVVWALSTRHLLAVAAHNDGTPSAAQLHAWQSLRSARARTDVVTTAFFLGTAAISLVVLFTALAVFAMFPRGGLGDIGAFLSKESRLPRSVGLRDGAGFSGSTAVVARLRSVPRNAFEQGLYLRGLVYDVIDLEGFSQGPSSGARNAATIELAAAPVDGRYQVAVMPLVGDTLLTLGGAVAARSIGGGTANPNLAIGIAGRTTLDELKADSVLLSPLRYEIAGGISRAGFVPDKVKRPPIPLTDPRRQRWLGLPKTSAGVFDPELAALASTVTASATTTREAAFALRRFLLEDFVYSKTPPREAPAPLRAFLLEDRRGHCEYFAAALALLLRSRDIPARVIGGFQGGAWDDGVVVFQARHAHAWVEWWDEEAGWIVDDATPLATAPRENLAGLTAWMERVRRFWDDRVIDYSMQDQADALSQARRAVRNTSGLGSALLFGLCAPGVLAAMVIVVWRRLRRREARGHLLAHAIVDAVARVNRAPVLPHVTVREAVASVEGERGGRVRDALLAALDLYERERFGGAVPADVERRRVKLALRRAL